MEHRVAGGKPLSLREGDDRTDICEAVAFQLKLDRSDERNSEGNTRTRVI